MFARRYPFADPAKTIIVFAVVSMLAAGLRVAHAETTRAAIGCEAVEINNMSVPVSFEDIGCKCFKKNCPVTPSQAPKPPPDQRKFILYEGRDVNGYDYDKIRNMTFERCTDACKADRRCSSFSFDKWNRMCFLKEVVPTQIRIEPKSIVAVMSTAAPTVSTAPTHFQRYNNAVFSDKVYRESRESSYEACQSVCDGERRCEAFMFIKSNRVCKLLENPSEYFRQAGSNTDSGVKRQLPP
jgi:hypothetical protein